MIPRFAPPRRYTVLFWWLFGAVSGVQIQISMLSHHHFWPLVVGYQVLVWSVWIAYSFAIGALVRRVPLVPLRPWALAFHVVMAVGFATLHTAIWVAAELAIRPYDFMNPTEFAPRFRSVTLFQLPLEVVLYGLVALAHRVADAVARERERERAAAQLEASLAEARLQALELQIQPHFLFNTLNGISALVRGGQTAEAIGMIGGLSDLLRYSLDRGSGARVALAEEIAMIERYLEIQRLRFAERLEASIEVPGDLRDAPVPVLALQPLVENAIRHGVERSHSPTRIAVRARRDGEHLVLEVWNTGRLDPGRRPGIGLSATTSRLAQMYGDRARVELAEEDAGVIARLRIPWSTGA
jgi:signal transduction histidine kinase